MVVRNEKKSGVLASVRSILSNSVLHKDDNGLPASISSMDNTGKVVVENFVIVDDFSYEPISAWKEWSSLKTEYPLLGDVLKIIRLNAHKGTGYAKNVGFDKASGKATSRASNTQAYNSAIIFVDAHILVSPYWLLPISSTLTRYPKALVYPVLDVLVPASPGSDKDYEGVIKSDPYLVAAFDWSLSPRWEQSSNIDRLKFTSSPPPKGVNDDEVLPVLEVPSPAAPGIFASKVDYLVELGKFDTALFSSYYNPAESIELSLRAWLCGGIVLKQTCSRVAHRNINLFEDTPVGNGAVQGRIDETTLNIAQKWLQGGLSLSNSSSTANRIGFDELVFRARFLERVPYGVELSIDLMRVTPAQSTEDGQSDQELISTCLSPLRLVPTGSVSWSHHRCKGGQRPVRRVHQLRLYQPGKRLHQVTTRSILEGFI